MHRLLREHLLPLLVFAALVPIAARGQGSTSSGGASVIVLDSADIASSGARTLSELLMARVPGLSVRPRGGLESEGAEVAARGMIGALGVTPMLVIDGVLADGDQALPVPGTSATISRLDDLVPADVQRVEVLRGPAAAARYGFGGGAGVIAVTTRRGSAGPLALDVAARAGLTDLHADLPANYNLTSGAPQQTCNPLVYYSTTPGCTPTTLYQWSPLVDASPFRVGRATAARVDLAGTTFGARSLLALDAERADGITSDEWQSRLGARVGVERELPGNVTVSVGGSYLERRAAVPARGEWDETSDNVFIRGLLGQAYPDSLEGYARAEPAFTSISIPEPSLVRVTSALRVGWRPLAWLTVDAHGGQDRAQTSAFRTGDYVFTGGQSHDAAVSSERWKSGTMHLGAEARYAIGALGAPIGASTYLGYDDVRSRDIRFDSLSSVFSATVYSYSVGYKWRDLRSQEATVRQHLGSSETAELNAMTRWPVSRGVAAPFGVESSRSVDAAVRLPSFREGLDLRLRAAAGRVPLVPMGTISPFARSPGSVGYGYPPPYVYLPLRTRRSEVEGGIDATVGGRTRVGLTWYDARTTDLAVSASNPFGPPVRLIAVNDRGVELLASAEWLDGQRLSWRTTLTAATLHSRVTDAGGSPMNDDPYQVGYPPQGVWKPNYTWADANGDGYVGYSEVASGYGASYVGPSVPTVEVGLRNAVTLPGAVTLGALLDYRGGYYRDDRTEKVRCSTTRCLAINDLSQPLDAQARAVALARGYTNDPEPASFLRLREVVLDWASPARRYAVRVVGQNLATWTRYPGIDPEVGGAQFMGVNGNTDAFMGPIPRRVSVEIRVGAGRD